MKISDSKYLLAYLLVILFLLSYNMTRLWLWTVPICAFIIIPGLELLLPKNKENFTQEEELNRNASFVFDFLLYLNLPLIFLVAVLALYRISMDPLSVMEIIGLVFSAGIILSANGINVAHEIGHRPQFFNQTISRLMLLPSLYMHFNIEHNLGHHKHVATPKDPATAKMGQTFYGFLPRTLIGGFLSALPNRHLSKPWNPSYIMRCSYRLYIVFSAGSN